MEPTIFNFVAKVAGTMSFKAVGWLYGRFGKSREIGQKVFGIGTTFDGFHSRGPGDNADNALFVQIRNQDMNNALSLEWCVYFAPKKPRIPVLADARRSQFFSNGYEAKFGDQWQSLGITLAPGQEVKTYIPLSKPVRSDRVPQGKRGAVLFRFKSGHHEGNYYAEI